MRLILATLLAVAPIFPAVAQTNEGVGQLVMVVEDVSLVAPVQPTDWRIYELAATGNEAYHVALAAQIEATSAGYASMMAYDDLLEALAAGEVSTTPDPELAQLGQNVINARAIAKEAVATYQTEMANFAAAEAAYQAALPLSEVASMTERLETLEAADHPVTLEDLKELNERLEALEAGDFAVTNWCVANASTTLCRARAAEMEAQ